MTIFGWDMSHFDAPSIGNALSQGVKFMTHKAGGDTKSGDAELDDWWSNVKGISDGALLLGAYWVPRPDLYSNPVSEAARFLATLDARCPGWRTRDAFILQVDAEIWNQDAATKPNASYLTKLCDRLVARTPGYVPVVYASKGQYGSSLGNVHYPLWNANYPTSATGSLATVYAHAGGDSGPGWVSYSGQMPAIWQFSSSVTIGGQTTCDGNAFRGTLAALKTLVTPGWDDDMPTLDEIGDEMDRRLTSWSEIDPLSTTTPPGTGRVGGWVRMMEARRKGGQESVQQDIASVGTRLDALAGDVATISARLDALVASLTPPTSGS